MFVEVLTCKTTLETICRYFVFVPNRTLLQSFQKNFEFIWVCSHRVNVDKKATKSNMKKYADNHVNYRVREFNIISKLFFATAIVRCRAYLTFCV